MTSTLNCLQWMSSQAGQDPCTIAQEVNLLCNATYAVSATNFKESSYVPNATTTNGCTCSWSMYNLLSACSYCVGQYGYTRWNTWTTNCGKYVSNNSYLPSGLQSSHGIPFWAATNPGTWYNAVFNITEAANIAEQVKPDVFGGALTTPTTSTSSSSTSSSSSVSTKAIAGGVIGGILILIIGALLILWMVRRRRRQRTPMDPIAIPSFNTSPPVAMPSTLNRTSAQPIPFGYARAASAPLTSPVHSTTSLPLMSPSSPISAGFSSNGHNARQLISDAADMITPFLATSPQTNRSSTSPTSKAAEALAERVMAPPGSRGRLNPPSYSASVQAGPSGAAATSSRRLSSKKRKGPNRSGSGTTTFSGHSRTSTKESVTTAHGSSRTEQGRPRAATSGTVQSMESVISAGNLGSGGGGGSADGMPRDRKKGVSDRPRPPAI